MAVWTTKEDQIIREIYPTLGHDAVAKKLHELGYERTYGAIRMRASYLGVQRSERTPPRDKWTAEEIETIRKYYPIEGATGTAARLRQMGYDRTEGSIRARAAKCEIRQKRKRIGKNKTINFCFDTVMDRELIAYLESKHNRSEYLRNLVRKDMMGR